MTEQEAYENGLARGAEVVSKMIAKTRNEYLEKVLSGGEITEKETAAIEALNDLDSEIEAYVDTIGEAN